MTSDRGAAKLGQSPRVMTREEWFRAGNIIWSWYWRRFDLVLAYCPTANDKLWQASVIECDEEGTPKGDAQVRSHGTEADKRNRLAGWRDLASIPHKVVKVEKKVGQYLVTRVMTDSLEACHDHVRLLPTGKAETIRYEVRNLLNKEVSK